jgi:hypothetical protein
VEQQPTVGSGGIGCSPPVTGGLLKRAARPEQRYATYSCGWVHHRFRPTQSSVVGAAPRRAATSTMPRLGRLTLAASIRSTRSSFGTAGRRTCASWSLSMTAAGAHFGRQSRPPSSRHLTGPSWANSRLDATPASDDPEAPDRRSYCARSCLRLRERLPSRRRTRRSSSASVTRTSAKTTESRRKRYSASTPTMREGLWKTRLHGDHRRSRDRA